MLKDEIAECCKKLRLSQNLAESSETVEAETDQAPKVL